MIRFFNASITAGYAWNSAPIDDTYTLKSILAIGCALRFTLNTNLNDLPFTTHNNTQVSLDYLKPTNSSRHFLSST